MNKVLVAYFSASGVTERVARQLAYGFEGKTVRFFATSGGSDVSGADKQFQAQYPAINWKPGKLLNGASKKTIEDWIKD